MRDAGILGVTRLRSRRFERGDHAPGLFGGYPPILSAVEDPNRNVSNHPRRFRPGVFRMGSGWMPVGHGHPGPRGGYPAADRNQGREALRVAIGDGPRPVAAQRESGEVGPLGIAAELGNRRIERGERHPFDLGSPPPGASRRLGHHHQRGEIGPFPQNGGQSDLGLPHAVGAHLPAAVEEEDDRGIRFGAGQHGGGYEDLPAVRLAVHFGGPGQNLPGLPGLPGSRGGRQQAQSKTEEDEAHGGGCYFGRGAKSPRQQRAARIRGRCRRAENSSWYIP